MTIVLAAAYIVVLALVLRARTYGCFAAYLVGELVKLAFYEPGVGWYVWTEPGIMTLKVLAVAETWWWLTYYMERDERRATTLAGFGVGLGLVALALSVWAPESAGTIINQARLSVHLLAGGMLGVAALWLAFHPVRMLSGARFHAWVMTAYLGMFAWIGMTVSDTDAEWAAARLSFRAGVVACLLLWAWYQCPQLRHFSPQRRDFGAE